MEKLAKNMKILHKIYYFPRRILATIVKTIGNSFLQIFFLKVDHWLRIRCTASNVLTKRNGLKMNLDLVQLIDNQIYFESTFEPLICKAFDRLVVPGMTVIDIGANVGIHTLYLARMVGVNGRVYAIEPTDWGFHKLLKNLALNPELKQTVDARQIALTDKVIGTHEYQFRAQWSKSGDYVPLEEGKVLFTTLDGFVEIERLKKLDFIKLDVDGYETKILIGGMVALTRFRPLLVVEMSDFFQRRAGNSAAEMIDILRGLGYEFYHEDLTIINGQIEKIIYKLKDWEAVNIFCLTAKHKQIIF